MRFRNSAFAYALGAMGLAAASQTLTILLLRFLTDSVAISAAIASAIIAAAHFYDALIDPAIGHLSDRTQTRWGRRRPYLFIGSLVLPLSIIGLFNIPSSLSSGAIVVYVAALLFIQGTSGSLYKVPYAALTIENCASYHERSRLMAFRVCGNSLGLMLGSTVPSWMLAQWGASRASYGTAAWVIGGIVFLCCLGGVLLAPQDSNVPRVASRSSWREHLQRAWDNKPFRVMCAAHACFMIGVASVGVANAYFTRYVLNASDAWLGLFYVIMVLASLASLPAWLKASKAFDKKPTYIFALAIYSLLHLTWLWSSADEPLQVRCFRVLLIGVALGGVMLLAFSIIADVIRYDAQHGERREGTLSGIQSIIDRAFAIIGIMAMGVLLSSFGYVASDDATSTVQPDSAITAIYIAFAILPALAGFLSIVIFSRYDLTAQMLQESVAQESDTSDSLELPQLVSSQPASSNG